MDFELFHFDENISEEDLLSKVKDLNTEKNIS